MNPKRFCASVTFLFFLTSSLSLFADAQQNQRDEKTANPLGTPLLWREPVDLASRNLYLGPGGDSMKPDLGKLTFLEEKASAASAKFRVL